VLLLKCRRGFGKELFVFFLKYCCSSFIAGMGKKSAFFFLRIWGC
jgi:hypothetical protein